MTDTELKNLAKKYASMANSQLLEYTDEGLVEDFIRFGTEILDSVKNKLLRAFVDQEKFFEQESKPHTGNKGF